MLVDDLPAGIERAIARIIEQRVGASQAITKGELYNLVRAHIGDTKNLARKVRVTIHALRNKGMLICSSSSGSGYWLAASHAEANEFIREMKSRGLDILRTAKALEKSANETYVQQSIRML